jgi:hypothetical protein
MSADAGLLVVILGAKNSVTYSTSRVLPLHALALFSMVWSPLAAGG